MDVNAFGVPLALPSELRWTDLGTLETFDGRTAPITVTIGEQTTSFFTNALAEDGSTVGLAYAEDPNGTVWVDADLDLGDFAPEAIAVASVISGGHPELILSANRVLPLPFRGVTMIPNNPSVELISGDWTLAFLTTDSNGVGVSGSIELGLMERAMVPRDENGLTLALHLGPSAPSAADAGSDPDIDRLLDRIDVLLGQAGLFVSQVEYIDEPQLPVVAELDSACLPQADLYEAVSELHPSTPGALNLIFIEAFACEGNPIGAQIAGIAGGVPGVPWSQTDGVYISTWPIADFPEEWSNVAAHEIGHFLGLFHTYDAGGLIEDQLDDTDGTSSSDNLMNPAVNAVETVTDDQAWVLRRSPWAGAW